MIKICLADCHRLFLEGLVDIISAWKDAQIVGSAINEHDLRTLLQIEVPDLLIIDFQIAKGNPVKFIASLKAQYPEIKILILTSYEGSRYYGRILNIGINGYLLKNLSRNEFLDKIIRILEGEVIITNQLLSQNRNISPARLNKDNISTDLTERELQVLQYIAQEFSNQEIAKILHLSTGTIDTHRKNIIAKLGVKNTVGLIKYAIYNKLAD